MRGTLMVGTSGFAYKEWVGPFYPPGTKPAGMLGYYASVLDTVEVNHTFRRAPTEALLSGWVAKVPPGFVFACKAHQGITHFARLGEAAGERVERFLGALAPLGGRKGPVLFQCPPNLSYDRAVLDGFLAMLVPAVAAGSRFALEFRHPSFDSEEVRSRLSEAGVAWCVADTLEAEATPGGAGVSTDALAPSFVYLRLRREGGYDTARLSRWAEAVRTALDAGVDVYAFLKHEDSATGPRDAAALRDLVGSIPVRGAPELG